jgi:anthranilate synthase component 1
MTKTEFRRLAAAGFNRIPLHLETLADLDTPLSIYLKLANKPGSYLLESVIGGERFGRYSIVGLPAREWLEVSGNRVSLRRDGEARDAAEADDPLDYIDRYLASFRTAPLASTLRFAGGLAGYFGYDTVRYIEPRLRGARKPDPLGLPEVRLLLSEELAVVDNLSGKLHLIVYADPSKPDAFEEANARLSTLRVKLRDKVQASSPSRATAAGSAALQHRPRCVLRRGRAQQAPHHRRRHHAGAGLAAAVAAVRRVPGQSLPRAALDQPRRRTCSISTSATASSSALRRRSSCGAKATRSRCVPSPARASAARRRSAISRWSASS